MPALVIGEDEERDIARAIKYAQEHRFTAEQIKRAYEAKKAGIAVAPLGEAKECRVELPIGFRVAYTEEYQPRGLMRHLSCSIDRPGGPHPLAVAMIMEAYGFKAKAPTSDDCFMYLEYLNPNDPEDQLRVAINVMEKI